MKKLGIALGLLLGALLLMWLGLMVNFPGEALSRFVAAHVVRRAPELRLDLAPAELSWTRLSFPRATFALNQGGRTATLFALKDLAIPLPWRLLRGLPLEAALGAGGRIDLFFPWREGPVRLAAENVRLEDLAGLKGLLPGPAKGSLSLVGDLEPERTPEGQLRRGVPGGTLTVTGRELVLGPFKVLGQDLPAARLDSVDVRLKGGNVVQVEQFNFRGDIQGEIQGTVTPNLARPESSILRLQVAAAFRQDWAQQLGILQSLMEPYLENGRLLASLTGTVERPNLRVNSRGNAPAAGAPRAPLVQPPRR